MIQVLYFSDRDVKRKLFEQVGTAPRLLLVTAVRHGKAMSPVDRREPFASLARKLGDLLDFLVVADEGTVEGMWRDPVGDLADALFPDDRGRAYVASAGYLLLERGAVKAVVKKSGAPREDVWWVQEAVAKLDSRVPSPDPAARPGRRGGNETTSPGTPRPARPRADSGRPGPARPLPADAWAMLGIARGTPHGEARKAFRALITQYHPDKVAHLAAEFRELAEQRTRAIVAAWDEIEDELGR